MQTTPVIANRRSQMLSYRKPREIPRPGADSSGNPHPDQAAANKAKGVDVYLVMAYSRPGLTADTFKVRRWSSVHGTDQQPLSQHDPPRKQAMTHHEDSSCAPGGIPSAS